MSSELNQNYLIKKIIFLLYQKILRFLSTTTVAFVSVQEMINSPEVEMIKENKDLIS